MFKVVWVFIFLGSLISIAYLSQEKNILNLYEEWSDQSPLLFREIKKELLRLQKSNLIPIAFSSVGDFQIVSHIEKLDSQNLDYYLTDYFNSQTAKTSIFEIEIFESVDPLDSSPTKELILQMSLIDISTKNKFWEMARTVSK